MKILVTGALGFIGSHFIKWTLAHDQEIRIVAFDTGGDVKSLHRLSSIHNEERLAMKYGDFCNDISELMEGIDIVFHFGAKTFVDHSVKSPESFVKNNIYGTFNILEAIRKWDSKPFMVYISTDEVYGQTERADPFTEDDIMKPTNPYSACKGAGELLVQSYYKTYGVEYLITRCENNYGSYQHPQKALPVFVKHVLEGKPIPLYNPGTHRRKWLHVSDHCDAIWCLIQNEIKNQTVNIAGGVELTNLKLAKTVLAILGVEYGRGSIQMVDTDKIRPFHDTRYHIKSRLLELGLGWKPKTLLANGLQDTIGWFKENRWWLE